MSALGIAVTELVGKEFRGKQSFLAAQVGFPESAISRLCSGANRITRQNLAKLCSSLSKEDAVRIAIAHLRDELPPSLVYAVSISASENPAHVLKEEAISPNPFLLLDTKAQNAVAFIAEKAIVSADARALVISLAQLMKETNSETK